jgi:hypothetical protein
VRLGERDGEEVGASVLLEGEFMFGREVDLLEEGVHGVFSLQVVLEEGVEGEEEGGQQLNRGRLTPTMLNLSNIVLTSMISSIAKR